MMSEEISHPKGCPPVGTYLRNKNTGDLARVVVHEGKVQIKPDIPGSPVYYPGAQHYNWNIESKAKKLPPGSFARVAYEADRALCEIHPDMKKQPEWLSLHPNKKAEFIEARMKFDNVLRQELYNAIIRTLESNSE
jgi:hypothetical protein